MAIGADAVSAHLTGLDERLADRLDSYRTHLQSQPLATHTRRAYAGRVSGYLSWLAATDPALRRQVDD